MLTRFSHYKVVLALLTCVALSLLTIRTAQASRDEMALFFDELVPYGDWVDYKQYGPVWYPTKDVEEGWRPYLDGRWVPSAKGWVFETTEPWGWATYHFGNWIPTTEYGWVWVPGGTWYPSTATWRKGKEAIGWAPTPPPEYEPEPAFTPPGGFAPETPAQVQVVPAMYVFTPGAVFIQGMGQPYAPEYSYQNCGELVPPEQLPELLPMTGLVSNFTSEAANPEAVANWGPPLDQVSECTGVSPMALMNAVNGTNITMVQNCWPSSVILARNPYFIHGRFFPDPWGRVRMVSWHDGVGHGHWETHGNRRVFVDDWRGVRGHAINRSFPVKLPPGTGPKAPGWPPKAGKIKPSLMTAKLDPSKRVLGLPATATAKASGMQKAGNRSAAPSSKGPFHPESATTTASPQGTVPAAMDRRAQLAQERAKMEEQKHQMQQAKLGGSPEGASPGKPGSPGSAGKSSPPGEHSRSPVVKSRPAPSASTTAKTAPAVPPRIKPAYGPQSQPSTASPMGKQPSGQPPPTAEQLREQRQAQEQARIQQLQQKQQAGGLAAGGQPARPAGPGGPPSGGPGMGSASSHAPNGSIRPPRTSSGSVAGGPTNAPSGGGAIRPPRSGSGAGSGPGGLGQPSMAGRQGGVAQTPRGQTQQVKPAAPPKSGGGGKATKQKEEKKKQ